MPDVIRPLPEEVTDLIRALGGRKMVLLEGRDDVLFFTEVFLERLADVIFLGVSGKQDVIARLSDLAIQRPDVSAFGIVDRDFASDADVQQSLIDPASRCFILRRYAVENYALEPQILWNVLRVFLREKLIFNSSVDIEQTLLTFCVKLQTMTAANFVIQQTSKEIPLFRIHDAGMVRENTIQRVAELLDITETESEQRIAEREALIGTALKSSLDEAHVVINGKHLLFLVWESTSIVKTGLSEKYLFSQLVDRLKSQPIHPDLRYIVENRILGDT